MLGLDGLFIEWQSGAEKSKKLKRAEITSNSGNRKNRSVLKDTLPEHFLCEPQCVCCFSGWIT